MGGIDLLNIDYSVFYQLCIFLLTVLVLSKLLINPVVRTLTMRREQLAQAEGETGLESEIAAKEAKYSEMLQSVRNQTTGIRQEIREEAKSEEHDIVGAAQASAREKLEESRKAIADSLDSARGELKNDVPMLAREIARKLFGREI